MPVVRLVDREPRVGTADLLAALVPPPRFAAARFATFHPDPEQPSQAAALDALTDFAGRLAQRPSRWRRRPPGPAGVYLDGGYGVGKTHLLTALWHAAPAPRAYCTFVELTHLAGALGFAGTVAALSGHRLLAVDEFELDDPGDTVLVSSLLGRLVDAGVHLAATSNTLPDALGEGRFSTEDFLREIQGLRAHFRTLRIDGPDYRHRGRPEPPGPLPAEELAQRVAGAGTASLDGFESLLQHLARLHPSRYGALVDGLDLVGIEQLAPLTDQAAALRLVVLADRLYDRSIPVAYSGEPLDRLFPPELLAGGYRKKYLRALSRLTALSRSSSAGR